MDSIKQRDFSSGQSRDMNYTEIGVDLVSENSVIAEAASLGNSSEVETAQEAEALTHVGPDGRANMVDVGGKADTEREAVAVGSIFLGMAHQ
jgi:hypothetical protein